MSLVITTRELRDRDGRNPIPAFTLGQPLPTSPSSALKRVDFGAHGIKQVWPDDLRVINEDDDLPSLVGECLIGYAPVKDTRWAAWNAVTEYVDHEREYKKGKTGDVADVRMNSIVWGYASDIKKKALELLAV